MKNRVLSKRLFIYFIAAFFLAFFSFAVYTLVSGGTTFGQMEGWDGVSVATEFAKGNGTEENPYVIQDAAEFIYFKRLIEGEESSFYQDKYYVLEEDINFNGNSFTPIGVVDGEEERFFAGHLNGNGHALVNFRITEATTVGDKEYYSLFTKTNNAFISSLGLVNFRIVASESEKEQVISSFVGEVVGLEAKTEEELENETEPEEIPLYKNLYLREFYLDFSKASSEHSTVGVLIGNVVNQAIVKNVFLHGEVNSNHSFSSIPFVQDSIENTGNLSLFVTNVRVINGEDNSLSYSGIQDAYYYDNGVFYNQLDEAVAEETVLSFLNDDIGEDYYWAMEDEELVIYAYQKAVMVSTPMATKGFSFNLRSAAISLHDSGVDGTTVYVNDLVADYNYYMGLNYTERSNGSIPTTTNQELYTDENLVAVYIDYRGTEINSGSTLTGYVSLSEQYSDIIYYKYYPIDNGYVTIPLIDNPFADRPNNRAFNGWVTDYDGAVVSLDTDIYVRYVKIPVSDTNPISITMYASWTQATVANSATSNTLKSVQMVPVATSTPVFDNLPALYSYESMSSGTSSSGVAYPSGAVDGNGNSLSNQRCTRISRFQARTCYYYLPVATNNIVDGGSYYRLLNGTMQTFVVQASSYNISSFLSNGDNLAGYFKKGVPAGSVVGYYSATGVLQTSGSCSGTNCNNYYELMQYDATNTFSSTNYDYYYLVTRDTNIVYLTSNINGFTNSVPLTVTGINNNENHTTYRVDLSGTSVNAGADLRIEHCALYTGEIEPDASGPSSSTSDYVYGNFYNLKIGRGLPITAGTYTTGGGWGWGSQVETHDGIYFNAVGVVGGKASGTGSSGSPTRYSLIVESGYYNSIASVNALSSSGTSYVDAQAIYGNDIDRVQNRHTSMGVDYNVASIYGGTASSGSYTKKFVTATFKSGTYGADKEETAAGIYVGGLSGGTISSPAEAIIEGGIIAYINGGPLISTNLTNYNAIYANIKGGEIDAVFGGAARSETYGNRVINITGGTINYGVCGGSNGIAGSNSSNNRGTLNGSTFVRIGGNALIGTKNDSVFGIDSGSVFGAGNGNTSYSEIGSVNNSTIMIADSAVISKNVYGGGNYGSVKAQSGNASASQIVMDGGTVRGSIYGGGNNNGSGSTSVTSTITIALNGGTVENSIYGGSCAKGIVYGSTSVTINGGTVTHDVYGGGEGGYIPSNNNSTPGTYVRDNVAVVVNNGTISGSVYGGSAFGTVNAINETTTTSSATTTVTINGGTVQANVFGGGKGSSTYTPKVIGNITVNVNGGSIGKVFGGFDAAGTPNAGDVVYLTGGTIGDAFGGGNQTGQTTTNIYLQGARVNNGLYGGSNLLGTVTTSNVYVTSGIAKDVFGGNNLGGTTVNTNVTVTGGRFLGDIYGGGNEAPSTTSTVLIRIAPVNDVYGGGKQAGLTTSNVTIRNASFNFLYGGSNISGNVGTSNVNVTTTSGIYVFGGNNQGGTTTNTNVSVSLCTLDAIFGGGDNAVSGVSHVTVNGGNVGEVYGGGNEAGLTTSNVTVLDGSIGALFGGSNQSGNITTSNLIIGDPLTDPLTVDIQIGSLYGGNNYGGVTSSANITSYMGTIGQLFGGGNEASVGETTVNLTNTTFDEVYGGGNAAGVSGDTYLNLGGCTVTDSIYGGGNEGVVGGDAEVIVEDTAIAGNAYAGGNGSTAIVSGDTTITIKGTSEIGTSSSVAPQSGCVFGSGNAANTGTLADNDSKATVNITGGTIHGNVYGGPKMAVVYGTTETNIGASALAPNTTVNTPILIEGTVFGGGESNASGSTNYDWTFISVTEGITVDIDGTGYTSRGIGFAIHGSIFGSGNASSSSGDSEVYIKSLGTLTEPNKSISIQRANYLEIEDSAIELEGATDRTNDYSDILYSLNIIDKMVIKNGTALLLQHNANLLKELYSGVDVGGSLVPAAVTIDDNTKTVGRNVDNRIYMLPGQNLNVTINQNATAYGKVTGMTFFGMYQPYEGGYRYGLYDPSYDYNDPADAGLEIIGGSYVVGLHSTDHDITVDGFYSNYLDEDTFDKIITAYIDPTPIGETGYRWTIGFEAVNYEFTLTASKYSSLGTTELQLSDFATGDAIFSILGVDTSGLETGVSMVDSTLVPRVGRTLEQANQTLGLTMKAETQEWTGYGQTKFYSANGGTVVGQREYRTDSRQLPPSLMFYLYHAKNISVDGSLGSIVITVQVATPKNAIEYNIDFITITANIVARQFDDGDSYDASITYDKRYEMPSATLVNITNTSQFTAYFSLIAWNNQFSGVYGNNNDNFHVLITDHVLPLNTMITMLDFGANDSRPEYYYFRVTQTVYDNSVYQLQHDNEVTYPLSQFIKMDSTSTTNTYSDSASNLLYYDSDIGLVDEEFIFIFDFKECTQVTGDHLDNSVLFELRNNENRTVFTVLGIREAVMYYSTYESTNIVLDQTITGNGDYLYYNIADTLTYTTHIQYDETENRQSVIDTNYESSSMGLNISFLDRDGDPVSSSLLIGTYFMINNQQYFADADGVFRIKLSDKVSNLIRSASLMVYKNLPAGEYTIRYTLFASDDGLHNSNPENSVYEEFTVTVVSADNSLIVDCEPYTEIVDGVTGLNMNNSRLNTYTVQYQSVLSNPNFRVEVYKRSTNNVDDSAYTSIGFHYLFTNDLFSSEGNEVSISMDGRARKSFDFQLQTTDNLTSGTYRVVFKLYDNNQLIDSDEKYVIVHKNVE